MIVSENNVIKGKSGLHINVFPEKCSGCLICELRCALHFKKSLLLGASAIQVRRTSDGKYSISFAGHCDNCGICVRNCMYEALVPEED